MRKRGELSSYPRIDIRDEFTIEDTFEGEDYTYTILTKKIDKDTSEIKIIARNVASRYRLK